jgi:hypothetical protein
MGREQAYPDGTDSWVEIGVCNYQGGLWFFTYVQNKVAGENGVWQYISTINSQTYQNAFTMQLTGSHDANGYVVNIYLNNQLQRICHLPNNQNYADFSKEIFSNTGNYTKDNINSHYVNPYLCSGGSWSSWGSNAHDWYRGSQPQAIDYNRYLNSGSYVFDAQTK